MQSGSDVVHGSTGQQCLAQGGTGVPGWTGKLCGQDNGSLGGIGSQMDDALLWPIIHSQKVAQLAGLSLV